MNDDMFLDWLDRTYESAFDGLRLSLGDKDARGYARAVYEIRKMYLSMKEDAK